MRKTLLWLVPAILLIPFALLRGFDHWCMGRLTGMSATIHHRSLGCFEARDLVCTNYNAGGALITADVPLVVVRYEPLSLLRRELHIYELICEVRRISITRITRESRPVRESTGSKSHSALRLDALHLKVDGVFTYDKQTVTGKMETTLHDVKDIESLGKLFKSP